MLLAYKALISVIDKSEPYVVPSPFELFPPSREQGLKRLRAFVPHAGRAYAARRNEDPGPGLLENVSMLSPYIRYRLITEREVVAAVLAQHTPEQAEKFIQEVFWRTYWKGWLQMRPKVWADFLAERDAERVRVEQSAGLQKVLDDAEAGRTGIECFDDWAQELVKAGYLHNHTRMWFASIWIFTLKLPWSLGADFFLRHLIDADPASNTLSWRWVAGIQTPGKTYLARPDNIEKYTLGRYRPEGLATEAPPVRAAEVYTAERITATDPMPNHSRVIVLLHGDDLRGFDVLPPDLEVAHVLVAKRGHSQTSWPFGDNAKAFVDRAVQDVADACRQRFQTEVELIHALDEGLFAERADQHQSRIVVTPDAPVGPIDTGLNELRQALKKYDIDLYRIRRDWDTQAWPYAQKGFFPFKKQIPALLQQAGLIQ